MMAHLDDLYARRDLSEMQHEKACDAILTPEQRMQLVRIDGEYDAEYEEIADAIKAAEEQVKAAVVQAGETIKGQRYQAVYGKGRVSWDGTRLEEYFRANDPDALGRMRKVGKPSVSIRAVKG
jgi:hypothetical protein